MLLTEAAGEAEQLISSSCIPYISDCTAVYGILYRNSTVGT